MKRKAFAPVTFFVLIFTVLAICLASSVVFAEESFTLTCSIHPVGSPKVINNYEFVVDVQRSTVDDKPALINERLISWDRVSGVGAHIHVEISRYTKRVSWTVTQGGFPPSFWEGTCEKVNKGF